MFLIVFDLPMSSALVFLIAPYIVLTCVVLIVLHANMSLQYSAIFLKP